MKAFYILLSAFTALIIVASSPACAQPTLTVYHNFASFTGGSNNDGAESEGGLVLIGNTLFGAGYGAGPNNNGTIFSINKDGSGFSVVHAFSQQQFNSKLLQETNADGAYPGVSLVVSGNAVYGVTFLYGGLGYGTFFSIDASTSAFTDVCDFPGSAMGSIPYSAAVTDGNNFYSTAQQGGINGSGTIFKILPASAVPIYSFSTAGSSNLDGIAPSAALLLIGNTLYGTTSSGGANNGGTIFSVDVTSQNFHALHALNNNSPAFEGIYSAGKLSLIGNKLYGSAHAGGLHGNGTLFCMDTNGSNFTILHTFSAASGSAGTNADGTAPRDGFIYTNNTLYGTTFTGGPKGGGTIFTMGLDGGNFTVLYGFSYTSGANVEGCGVNEALVIQGNDIYGATLQGGANGAGTIFHVSLVPAAPQLTTARVGNNLVFSWPATFSNFTLQSSASLGANSSWSTVTPGPVTINGQNTSTISPTGPARFFRLISNGP